METRAKKAHIRESAEVIVVREQTHEGPNVKVMQIAVSKSGRISETEVHSNNQKRKSDENEGREDNFRQLYKQKEEQQVELIEWILEERNMFTAIKAVKKNKGAAGVDGMTVEELDMWYIMNGEAVKEEIRSKKYKPEPVRRVYIGYRATVSAMPDAIA